jgi:hypothetical protein
LALFGRRPPERVHGLVIPASENLHRSGLMHRSKQPFHSITSSGARAAHVEAERPSGLEIDRQLELDPPAPKIGSPKC